MERIKGTLSIRDSTNVVHSDAVAIELSFIFSCDGTFAKFGFLTLLPMTLPAPLLTLAYYLAGEFHNRDQAIAEPVWYVPLKLWHRPTQFFRTDSLTLFAEQANVDTPDNPYRQRLLRLQYSPQQPDSLCGQYYAFHNPQAVKGAGQNPALLEKLTLDDLELLPGCTLDIQPQGSLAHPTGFIATPPPQAQCFFSYESKIRQVILGFEAYPTHFLSYDRGIDPETGQLLWGAMMGPYRYTKVQAYPI